MMSQTYRYVSGGTRASVIPDHPLANITFSGLFPTYSSDKTRDKSAAFAGKCLTSQSHATPHLMNANSFTIHTELLDGSLSGARNIYLGANSTCHLYVIPRSVISLANSLPDISGQPAFYILSGGNGQKVYIGHTTDFANRKYDHVQKKDWWDTALVFISDNHKIYGDDVRYLEYLGIKTAQEASSCELLNGSSPKKPNIAPFRVSDMEVFFRDIALLAEFYGCRIFSAPAAGTAADRHLFFVKGSARPSEGKGYYDAESGRFVLLKGCRLASATTDSFKSTKRRSQIIAEKCAIEGDAITLACDLEIDSPSSAAGIVLGSNVNGWCEWTDAEGRTLASVYNHKS